MYVYKYNLILANTTRKFGFSNGRKPSPARRNSVADVCYDGFCYANKSVEI